MLGMLKYCQGFPNSLVLFIIPQPLANFVLNLYFTVLYSACLVPGQLWDSWAVILFCRSNLEVFLSCSCSLPVCLNHLLVVLCISLTFSQLMKFYLIVVTSPVRYKLILPCSMQIVWACPIT